MVQRNAPLAEQLIHELVSHISTGDLAGPDGRLPSEAELCQQYSVSRATVREALSKLELAGIVIRRHGVGTFVNGAIQEQPGLIQGWLDEAPAFANLIARSGHTAGTKLLDVSLASASDTSDCLGIAPDAQVVIIEKLFLADETPVIYSWTAIPLAFVMPDGGAVSRDESYRKTTYQLLEEKGHKVHHQLSEIRAVVADDRLAELLICQPGEALLRVEEIGYDLKQTPLFYALHNFRGDRISFRQIRRPSLMIDPGVECPGNAGR